MDTEQVAKMIQMILLSGGILTLVRVGVAMLVLYEKNIRCRT